MAQSGQTFSLKESTSPQPIPKATASSSFFQQPLTRLHSNFSPSSSPSFNNSPADLLKESYLPEPEPAKKLKHAPGLPHKFRPFSDYEPCDAAILKKRGIEEPKKSAHKFGFYIKQKDRDLPEPPIYFIKTSDPNSYIHEFEAFHAALFNLLVPGIIPSAHVIYDDTLPGNPPIGICTQFESSFIPVKDKAVTAEDLQDSETVKCVAEIIILAYLLEDDDLHAHNFGWATHRRLMRVDAGMALWNYLRLHPKLSSFLSPWIGRTGNDKFPINVKDIDEAPNYTHAKPYYSPSGESFLAAGSSGTLTFLQSKNQFKPEDMAVYKNPDNLQKKPVFVFNKFKLLLKSTFITREAIEECARLYLRIYENNKEVEHIEGYAKHIMNRLSTIKTALFESEEFKKFVTNSGAEAINKIWQEIKELLSKIDKKAKKPHNSDIYQGLFSSLQASHVKNKWREIYNEAASPAILKK